MLERSTLPIREPSLSRQKLALWAAFLVIILVSVLAFYTTQRLNAASQRVERAQAILIETSRFLSDLKDVESDARGFLITGEERYLGAHADAIQQTSTAEQRLIRLADSRLLGDRFNRIADLADRRIALTREAIEHSGSPAELRQVMIAGSDVMDRLKQDAATIIADQSDNYGRESASVEKQAWFTSIAFAAGVALCLALIAWLFGLRGRELRRRAQLEEELRALNVELEDRVEERTCELAGARDLLDAVVQNLPDMVILKEAAGEGFRYILINAAGEELLGRKRSEVVGKTEIELFPAGEARAVVEANREVLESGQPRTFTERELTTATGIRTVETRMVPITNCCGSSQMILAIVRDVTHSRSREGQLRLLQRMDAIGRLTGGVAHDFNNLLAIIHGNSELLLGRFGKQSDAHDMLEDILSAAGRGADLVRRLLAFARMQHLEPEPVDLNARLPNIVSLLERALGEDINVRLKLSDGLWPAIIDPTQVDDALVNLAINARDAMPQGGTLIIESRNVFLDEDYTAEHIELASGDYVMLAVSDTGTGMPPEVAERAFEPFFTTKEEGQGTGLGLSQVFGWVKQSGGHIKIYSEVEHGTTIKLYLPRASGNAAEKPVEPASITVKGDEKILVVEDNPNVRRTVVRQLHDLGYETVEAENGAKALELARAGLEFDLLLTDVIMPGGITGYDLAKRLREERRDLRVLFTSGYTELQTENDGSAGPAPLLSKPYRKQDLGAAVRAVLDSAH